MPPGSDDPRQVVALIDPPRVARAAGVSEQQRTRSGPRPPAARRSHGPPLSQWSSPTWQCASGIPPKDPATNGLDVGARPGRLENHPCRRSPRCRRGPSPARRGLRPRTCSTVAMTETHRGPRSAAQVNGLLEAGRQVDQAVAGRVGPRQAEGAAGWCGRSPRARPRRAPQRPAWPGCRTLPFFALWELLPAAAGAQEPGIPGMPPPPPGRALHHLLRGGEAPRAGPVDLGDGAPGTAGDAGPARAVDLLGVGALVKVIERTIASTRSNSRSSKESISARSEAVPGIILSIDFPASPSS